MHHAGVAEPYEAEFFDVPNQAPTRPMAIRRVSITNQKAAFVVDDPLFGRQHLLCDVVAGVSLRAGQRGVHMSRIGQSLRITEVGRSLPALAMEVAETVRARQGQDDAETSLTADVMVDRSTTVTALPTADRVTIAANAILGLSAGSVTVSLAATNMTSCPCMQAYAVDHLRRHLALDAAVARDLLRSVPVATHSQKGRVELAVTVTAGTVPPTYAALHGALASATVLTCELLKRPDEYDIVTRAHLRPQFVEDVARETVAAAARMLPGLEPSARVRVRAESFESIHGHDIEADLDLTLDDARALVDR
jgi:GTP cyclohydrolase-4